MKPISIKNLPNEDSTDWLVYDIVEEWWTIAIYTEKRGFVNPESWEEIGDRVSHYLPMLPAPDSAAWRECAEGEGE